MVWASIAVFYVIAAFAFYTLSAKTADAQTELVVVESAQDSISKAA